MFNWGIALEALSPPRFVAVSAPPVGARAIGSDVCSLKLRSVISINCDRNFECTYVKATRSQ